MQKKFGIMKSGLEAMPLFLLDDLLKCMHFGHEIDNVPENHILVRNIPPPLKSVIAWRIMASRGLSLGCNLMPRDLAIMYQSQYGIFFDCFVWPLTL